ncbi:hypothetical protein ACTQ45_06145 [Fundicoccus sp. Sow4_D5]|uniref:hypothetical protein n=1 Tax=Fundicoccus sp. Sow4_D5 TaxID=3438782 RepID=UPI003F90C873
MEDKNKALDIENKLLKELRRLQEAEKRQHKDRQCLPFAISMNRPIINPNLF